jgi:HAD superfamily phosphatase (TIGR01668 family)
MEQMLALLQPNLAVDSIFHIDLAVLRKKGIKYLLIDMDNTITEWNNHCLPDRAIEWFQRLDDFGIKACLVSNNTESKVNQVAKALGVPSVGKAQKPRKKAFRKAMELLGARRENTAMVGDQIFTDVLGGNRLGLFTILVIPVSTKEFFGTKFVRLLEKIILKKSR